MIIFNKICHVVFFSLLLLGTPALAQDQLAPPPRRVPPTLPDSLTGSAPGKRQDIAEMKQWLEWLRATREALETERQAAIDEAATGRPDPDLAGLRKRLRELLTEVAARSTAPRPAAPAGPLELLPPQRPTASLPAPRPPAPSQPSPPSPPPRSIEKSQTEPLDALALGHSLFRLGDCESALLAYRQVDLTGLKAEDRVPVQYLIATCLRRTGKLDEAARIYREVAGSRGDPFFAECARWQVTSIRWRQDLEARLAEVQQRRQALEGKK